MNMKPKQKRKKKLKKGEIKSPVEKKYPTIFLRNKTDQKIKKKVR